VPPQSPYYSRNCGCKFVWKDDLERRKRKVVFVMSLTEIGIRDLA
jgi:hypothetical protein